MSQQWDRQVSLIVAVGEKGLDLSQLRFTFKVSAADVQSPNNANIRVYNLSDETARKVQNEYTRVILQAGYRNGNFGVIFDGTIKQIRRGKESPVVTYLDILAADGDLAYNFSMIGASLAAGATVQDRLDAITKSMAPQGVTAGYTAPMSGGILPRGKVLFGMARDHMRNLANTTGTTWSIQNGKVQVLPLTGYLPGQAVVLTSRTGLIGMPEQTENGINVVCLLNPRIQVGGLIKLDNRTINQTINKDPKNPIPFDRFTGVQLLAKTNDDGLYRVYVVEHQGDTRGNDWYTNLVCLAADPTAPADKAVKAYG